ncbi:MAG: metallophosphoesterase family protein [bacterium]
MRLLCITDIHSDRKRFEQILQREQEPDLLIIGGDFTNFGPPPEAEGLLDLALLHCPIVLAVAGNCDSSDIDAMLHRRGVSLHANGKEINGIGFFGLSAMPPWRGDMYEFSEKQLDFFLSQGYDKVKSLSRLVLVSHPPPHNTKVDRNASGRNVGSTAVRAWMDKAKPVLVVCGHIHEARGVDESGGTKIVNCGPARNGYYAVADVAEKVTIELKQIT